MQNSLRFLLSILIAQSFLSCGITYKPDHLPSRQLSFGEGGGFTGGVIEWVVLENGQIFKRNNFTQITEERTRIRKKKAEALYTQFKTELDSLTYIKPGNLYRFVQLKSDSSNSHRIVWGEGDPDVPAPAKAFYDSLMGMIRETSAKKK